MRDVYLGPRAFEDVIRAIEPQPFSVNPHENIFGLPVHVSHAFPFDTRCGRCNGSGAGAESTYCPTCKGRGAYAVEGFASGARGMTVFTNFGNRPRLFEPSCPVEVPRRPLSIRYAEPGA